MDWIKIHGIHCDAMLGVTNRERKQRQSVRIDIAAALDLEAAANTDKLELTVDYHKLVKRVQKTVLDHEFLLVESLAGALAKSVLTDHRISTVRVRVYKFPESLSDDIENVMVEIERKA